MKRRLIKLISMMIAVASLISSVTTYAVGCNPVDVPEKTYETGGGSGDDCVPYGPQYIYRTEYFEAYRDVFPVDHEDQSPEGVTKVLFIRPILVIKTFSLKKLGWHLMDLSVIGTKGNGLSEFLLLGLT